METYLWPLKGGTRRECWGAMAVLLELWLIWVGLYILAWTLK